MRHTIPQELTFWQKPCCSATTILWGKIVGEILLFWPVVGNKTVRLLFVSNVEHVIPGLNRARGHMLDKTKYTHCWIWKPHGSILSNIVCKHQLFLEKRNQFPYNIGGILPVNKQLSRPLYALATNWAHTVWSVGLAVGCEHSWRYSSRGEYGRKT